MPVVRLVLTWSDGEVNRLVQLVERFVVAASLNPIHFDEVCIHDCVGGVYFDFLVDHELALLVGEIEEAADS